MEILPFFLVLLVVGRLFDRLDWDEVVLFVVLILSCYIAIRLLRWDLLWMMPVTLLLNVVLIYKVIGYDPAIRRGRGRNLWK